MTRRDALLAAAGLCAAVAGCEGRPRTVPVRGRVTYQNRPLAGGTVTFVPFAPGPASVGTIQPDGRYALTTFLPGDGAVPGRYAVMVVAVAPTTYRLPEEAPGPDMLLVPRKYASHRTSGLTRDVGPGDNVIDLPLD
jgi:hypothetical protein